LFGDGKVARTVPFGMAGTRDNCHVDERLLNELMFLHKTFKALNGPFCADVPLRNYSPPPTNPPE